jgi:homogentisate 1,2-dioxygenase
MSGQVLEGFEGLKYHPGFGNHVATEALEGALPVAQNSPQVCSYGLYAEQLSGSAFTAPRHKNLRSWLYRIRPSVQHSSMTPSQNQAFETQFETMVKIPNQLRWNPLPIPSASSDKIDFLDGLRVKCGAGDPSLKEGIAIFDYLCNSSMTNRAFYSADGDMLIAPQSGTLFIKTEMGRLVVEPCEIVVIPRGIKFQVLVNGEARGYGIEVFTSHFELPGLGPIGSNGLANPRDFENPSAAYEDIDESYEVVVKYLNKFFHCSWDHSPFDVVAWHGNYTPFKYDLRKFNCMNSVTYDHPDPSIYTVLTCPSAEPGVAAVDFVIFPPRWMVMEHTFRPPWYHRNCMSEYMGMIFGQYDAKGEGFVAGGSSLHSCMTGHGPDAESFVKASSIEKLTPFYFSEGLAFMFESKYILKVAPAALETSILQEDYLECWQKLPKIFNGQKSPSINWDQLKEQVKEP